MRLQTFLSASGISSRRKAALIIKSGRIYINGKKVLEPSFKVDPEKDRVFLNNRQVFPKEKIYLMLNKPKGVTTTKRDPFALKTVMDLLPHRFRHLNPVGRLDKDTKGLIILTNDGRLLNRLTHPRFNVKKLYSVRLDRRLARVDMMRLQRGIELNGRHTAPCKIGPLAGSCLQIEMREGRKRQIRRMFDALGYKVRDLKRLKEGPLDLGALREGRWRVLSNKEAAKLKSVFSS